MKIAVSSDGPSIDDLVESRFGRCPFFVFVDTETMEYESVENEYKDAMGGAGVQAAQTIANNGAEALITGNVGPNAFKTLESAGIDVYKASGPIKEAVGRLKEDELESLNDQTVPGHFGDKSGRGRGQGRKGGRKR